MNTFSDEVKAKVLEAQNGFCDRCFTKVHSLHHQLPNTKHNNMKFPLFIHSPMNAVGLCDQCHRDYPHLYKIHEAAAEMYEKYLQELKEKAKEKLLCCV